jgi:hypothetical protein
LTAPTLGTARPPTPVTLPTGSLSDVRVDGAAIVYRLFDVGFEIDLLRAGDLLASSSPARARPIRGEAQAILIANPPIAVMLGTEPIAVLGGSGDAEVSAHIFDFGGVSLRLSIRAMPNLAWSDYSAFGNAVDVELDLSPVFERHLRALLERIAPAITRPAVAPITEDYVVFRINAVRDAEGATAREGAAADGGPLSPATWGDEDLVPLLLNERRPLSATARRELLPHRFSYYTDDLTILTWDNALVVEPSPGDTDVQFILEFANAQLLELRVYDAVLDAELPAMYDRVASARPRRQLALLQRRFAGLLSELQALVADSTELVERVESALKVTDDVYLARIYTAALDIFRGREWRAGIDRKLSIIRETYAMLNDESQAARAEALEVLIVALIAAELVLPFFLR